MKKLLVILVVALSGCASTQVDRIAIKATPNRQNKFDFSVEFYVSKK